MLIYRMSIMKRLLFIFSFFYLSVTSGSAQDTLTLENCLEMGIENNLSLQSKRNEIQKGRYGKMCIRDSYKVVFAS